MMTVDSKTLEHGCWMLYAGLPSFFGLGFGGSGPRAVGGAALKQRPSVVAQQGRMLVPCSQREAQTIRIAVRLPKRQQLVPVVLVDRYLHAHKRAYASLYLCIHICTTICIYTCILNLYVSIYVYLSICTCICISLSLPSISEALLKQSR